VKRKSKAEAPSAQLTAKQRQEIKEAFNLIDIDEIGEVVCRNIGPERHRPEQC
jgi:Ca2+-binding EF-hand superfamily protein